MQFITNLFASLFKTRLHKIAETSVTIEEQNRIKDNAAKSKRTFFFFLSFCTVTTVVSVLAD